MPLAALAKRPSPRVVARLSDTPREGGEIAYRVGDGVYLNITSRCTARCGFCPRQGDYQYRGLDLRLATGPPVAEAIAAAGDPAAFEEIVFCGYGEPTLRLSALCEIADRLRAAGARRIRLNTNGHGSLIHRRNILPDLAGRIDAVSISLNSADPKQYARIMGIRRRGAVYFEAMVEFARQAPLYIPEVVVTAVDLPEVDMDRVRRFAAEAIGVPFRVRPLF